MNTTRIRKSEDTKFVPGEIADLNAVMASNLSKKPKTVKVSEAVGMALLEDIDELGGLGKILTQNDLDVLEKDLGRTTVQVNPRPTVHQPILRSINMIPQSRRDPISQMAFRHLKQVITEGVPQGWTIDLKESGPITQYVYGALEGDNP